MMSSVLGIVILAGLLVLCSVASYLRLLMRRLSPVAARQLFHTEGGRIRADRERVGISISTLHGAVMALFAVGLTGLFILREPEHFGEALGSALLVALGAVALVDQLIPFVLVARHDEPERILEGWMPFLRFTVFAALPLTFPILISATVSRLLESQEERKEEPPSPQEELQELIQAGEQTGLIERSQGKLLQAAVEFADTVVREVMTPRPEIAALPINASVEDLRTLFRQKPQSRYPVYSADLDHIEGIVHVQSLILLAPEDQAKTPLPALVQTVPFVPETKPIRELLKELQETTTQMAIVIDEYGSVSGLVTIEDLVEEIVGEIRDTVEPHAHDIVKESADTYLVAGHTELGLVADRFHLEVEGPDYSTVAGLILAQLGHVPMAGEKVERSGVSFEVLEANQRNVLKVRMKLISPEPAAVPANAKPDAH
jgi:CBS domain containing-hemolysin-like protein